MNYLIAYDMPNNKKRKKLGELLEKYGTRVNYSVFECEINKTKLKNLLKLLEEEKLIDKKTDSIRFYHLCQNCIPKSFELCKGDGIFQKQEFFI
jgi:CRISPR-associated protein Cas2